MSLHVSPDDKTALQIIRLAVEQAERIKTLEADNAKLRAAIRSAQCHRVGEYFADYSAVTQAELDEPSQEPDELFRNSSPAPRS